VTDKRQLGFGRVYLLDPADTLDGPPLEDVATEAIDRICRVDDHSPVQQAFNDHSNISGLRIDGMEVHQHGESYEKMRRKRLLS
jgi:hypothetical protein